MQSYDYARREGAEGDQWGAVRPPEVNGRVVAVVDEIADTGETWAMVTARVRERGATQVVAASLLSHSWANPMPEVVALTTEVLVIFPWDRRVYAAGAWRTNPKLEMALRLQDRG